MKSVVCSVPHSGTRTLVEHLGIGGNSPRGKWMHFGYFMDEPKIATANYHLHIPLRHPRDVASSWARRGKNLDRLLVAYRSMFTHLQQPHTIHKMEDIAVLSGGDDWDRDLNGDGQVSVYVDRIMTDVVQPHAEFFSQYYEDLTCASDLSK